MTDPLAEIKSAMYEAQYEAAVKALVPRLFTVVLAVTKDEHNATVLTCLEALVEYYLSRCPEELRDQVIEGSIRTIRETVKLYGELGR